MLRLFGTNCAPLHQRGILRAQDRKCSTESLVPLRPWGAFVWDRSTCIRCLGSGRGPLRGQAKSGRLRLQAPWRRRGVVRRQRRSPLSSRWGGGSGLTVGRVRSRSAPRSPHTLPGQIWPSGGGHARARGRGCLSRTLGPCNAWSPHTLLRNAHRVVVTFMLHHWCDDMSGHLTSSSHASSRSARLLVQM